MDSKVYYLNEKDTLAEALHVFYQSKCPLFVVVDNFEEYIGVLPIECVLYKLLGKPSRPEKFSDHRDKKAVAARRKKSESEEKVSETSPEVVE
jgi:Mg2+/Co2+ transporter CorB